MNPSVLPQANGFSFHVPPPATEHPPQIFGGYSTDGSPLPPNLSGPIFGDDSGMLLSDEGLDHNDPKRRRIARVYDTYTYRVRRKTTANIETRPAICAVRRK